MADKLLIIANLQYINPKRIRRGHGRAGLRSKLKYLTYREDYHRKAPHQEERWVDHGMGQHWREIQQHSLDQQSEQVLAWTWVVSPEPDVMQLVPDAKRRAFIKSLTEAIVEHYYDARDAEAQYSYVIHDAQTTDGRPHLHTHVILPGTAWSPLDGRVDFGNYQHQGHLTLLDDIAHEELMQAMDRTLGRRWRQVIGLEPEVPDDIGDLKAWFGQ